MQGIATEFEKSNHGKFKDSYENEWASTKRNLRRPLDLEDHYVSHDNQEQLQKPNSEYKSEKLDAKTPAIVIKKPDIVTCGDGYTVGFLNDDYCDCLEDGLDEPDTSACSNLLIAKKKFECGRSKSNDNSNYDSNETDDGGGDDDDPVLQVVG